MPSYAIVDTERPRQIEAILMIVEDRAEAEDIAFELRRRDLKVDVVEMPERRATD